VIAVNSKLLQIVHIKQFLDIYTNYDTFLMPKIAQVATTVFRPV